MKRSAHPFAWLSIGIVVMASTATTLRAGEIHEAARRGDSAMVQRLLKGDRTLLDAPDATGATVLHVATMAGQKAVVELLIHEKANVDAHDQYGDTPLQVATFKGYAEIVGLLIAAGARVDVEDQQGDTPLHTAALYSNEKIAGALLAAKATPNRMNRGGRTPLHIALYSGNVAITRMILATGVDVNVRTKDSATPLHIAAMQGHTELVRMLIERGADVYATDSRHGIPLGLAIRLNHRDATALLLDHYFDIHTRDSATGQTLLHFAAFHNAHHVIHLLIQRGILVDAKDSREATPLIFALENGNAESAMELIKHGADVTVRSVLNIPMLNIAARYCPTRVVEQMIAHGADVGELDFDGWSPMHYAALNEALIHQETPAEIVALLAQQGGEVDARSDLDETPLTLAAQRGNLSALRQLIVLGADVNAVSRHKLDSIDDIGGWTPLHFAALYGHETVVRILLENGANPNARIPDGPTPLGFAITRDERVIVNLLRDYGAED